MYMYILYVCNFQTENLIDHLVSRIHHFVLVTGTKYYMGPFDDPQFNNLPIPLKVKKY